MTETRIPPLLTLYDVAEYAGLSYETVRRAAVEYERSGGKRGLKTERRHPRAAYRVHVAERDRWISGEKTATPSKRNTRAA